MANVYGANRTKELTPTGDNRIDYGELRSDVKVIQDSYEFSSSGAGTVVEMGTKLPVGARVLDVEVIADALGGSVTFSVGDADDDDRYMSGEDGNSANTIYHTDVIAGKNYEVDGDDDQQILVTTAGATATGSMKIAVYYSFVS